MQTDNVLFDHPQPSNGTSGNSASQVKQARHAQAIQELKLREAELESRLEVRKKTAMEVRERQLAYLAAREFEFGAERTQMKQQLAQVKLDLEAAHRSAGEHCSEVGIQYVPGATTEADVLAVPLLHEAEVARRLGLPFGVGFNDGLLALLKPVLTVLCWLMSSLSLGLAFRLLDPRNILANPATVGLSLLMGGVVAVGLLLAVTPMWRSLGVKMGSCRPTKEVFTLLLPVGVVTALLLASLASLDANAIIRLNAARAALNPVFAIPMHVALLIGTVISGVYVLGLSGVAFADSYTLAARRTIQGVIKTDETHQREELKTKMPIREALEALAEVKVLEELLGRLGNDLKLLDQESKRERAELLASLPSIPAVHEPEERQELADLRARVRSARAHLDAHEASRGGLINGSSSAP